jgi:AbiV family abortive infection protein
MSLQQHAGLSTAYLLKGAFLAAEQASSLLKDAKLLYEHRRYGNCVVLSVYSLEEVGRSEIYAAEAKQAVQAELVTVANLKNLCKNHINKLRSALSSATNYVDIPGSWVAPSAIGSPEHSAQLEQFEKQMKLREQSAPKDTHQGRVRGLYVDPMNGGHDWNVPADTGEYDAWKQLIIAAKEYERHRLQLQKLLQDTPGFGQTASRLGLHELPQTITVPDYLSIG